MIPQSRVAQVARMYRTTREAAAAMGITPSALARLCQRYGIATPSGRRRQTTQADKARAA